MPLPAYLLAPPAANTVLPAAALPELPLAQLRWEDFERLCLRLVLMRLPIDQCEQYGVLGQK